MAEPLSDAALVFIRSKLTDPDDARYRSPLLVASFLDTIAADRATIDALTAERDTALAEVARLQLVVIDLQIPPEARALPKFGPWVGDK